jgi:hypothetical protein
MYRTVPNHYGVNANAANAEVVNANANVNMVNITNQGSNSTIPADPIEAEIYLLQMDLDAYYDQATHTSFGIKKIEEMNLKRQRLTYLLGETSVDPYSVNQPIHLRNLPLMERLNQEYGNYVMAALAVGLVGGFVGQHQQLDPKVTGILGAALGWGGYHLVMEHYAQKALANHVNKNMGYAG